MRDGPKDETDVHARRKDSLHFYHKKALEISKHIVSGVLWILRELNY